MAIIIHELEHRYEDGSAGEKVALHDVNIKIEQGRNDWSDWSYRFRKINAYPTFERPFEADFRGGLLSMERTSMTATFLRRNFAVKLDLYFNIRSISCLRVR